jgi:penicillin-binding protein 1A
MTTSPRRTHFQKTIRHEKKIKESSFLWGIFSLRAIVKFFGTLFVIGWVVGGVILYGLLSNTPPIESIERGDYFQESTVIYDKNKNPIYTLFNKWKRTYKPYAEISNSIKDALISTEDKTFFENPGIDMKGLIRAGLYYVTGKTDRIQWTSTLSQQLISYTLLSKERSVKRKIKEAYLSYKLNNNYSKEKILEMYLNTISFGNNANGIEEASLTYFNKSAKDVWPLGASILASLPKGPTAYSPYSQRAKLMGEVTVYPVEDPSAKISIDNDTARKKYSRMYNVFKGYLSGITLEKDDDEVLICGIKEEYIRDTSFTPDGKWCVSSIHDEVLNFFWDIIVRDEIVESGSTLSYALEYTWWRKDFVASRMFEDGKIDGETFKKVIYDGLEFQFQKYAENIKYPYFVMYVKEYLENKYGKDVDITQWLKVYTTIDPKLQDKAEELVTKQAKTNSTQYGAKSAALVSMDNTNGAILAMVGGPDYFDSENGGNNNMILAKRQPGSSFKPIIYGLAISKNPIWPASPVADVKTSFGTWKPDNYDGKFKWVMTVENALAYSRNIPAIKMYFLAGQEKDIAPFGQTLGLKTLDPDAWVGWALALWAEEVRPLDLMQAYSVFANLGIKRDARVIDKIVDSDGNVVEEYTEEKKEPIFSPAASYIISSILSNVEARPEWKWREYITVPGWRRTAVKTGTSDKKVGKLANGDDKILPRDLWTAGYTPQITTVVWVGNVDGKETYGSCDGLNCAAPIWSQFMEFAHKGLEKADWKQPEWIYKYTIVKSSGHLATEKTPASQKIETIMAVKLTDEDAGFRTVQIDTLCNWAVSENTPEWSIGTMIVPIANPVIDGYDPEWKKAFLASAGWVGAPCERPGGPGDIFMWISIVGIWAEADTSRKTVEWSWTWDREVKEWAFLYDGGTKSRQTVENKTSGAGRINIPVDAGSHSLTFEVTDKYGYRYRESRVINNGWIDTSLSPPVLPLPWGNTGWLSDPIIVPVPRETPSTVPTIPPQINLTRPAGGTITVKKWDSTNIRFNISVSPGAREVSANLWGSTIFSSTSWDTFIVPVSSKDLNIGNYTVNLTVTDSNFRVASRNVSLVVISQ